MINKIILDKISESLSRRLDEFKNLKLMEDELNIDKYIKKQTIKILKNDFDELNIFLNDYNIKLKKLLTKDQYFNKRNKRYEEENISKFCDLVLVYKENGFNKEDELEIKKTNKNIIPGSSIKQIKADKALLFFKYTKGNVELQVGYYFQSVEERIPFPDRSPRPNVSFNSLKETNKELMDSETSLEDVKSRTEDIFKDNWMEQLVSNWMDDVKSKFIKKSWFFITIRMFALRFINYYENLSEIERKKLKEELRNNAK